MTTDSQRVLGQQQGPSDRATPPTVVPFRRAEQLTLTDETEAASRFGRLVQLEPRLLGLLIRAARGEMTGPDVELEVRTLVGPFTTYRFADGRVGVVSPKDHGLFEVVRGDQELSSIEALDLALQVVTRAIPQQHAA